MKCPNCGETSRIREHDKFCHRCGSSLKEEKNSKADETLTIDVDLKMESVNDLIEKLKEANTLADALASKFR